MSRILRSHQIHTVDSKIIDTFQDGSIHSRWTQEAGSSIITEDTTKLSITDSNGSTLDWAGTYNSPNINIPVEPRDFIAKIALSNIGQANSLGGGIVHYKNGTKSNYHLISFENQGGNDSVYSHYNAYNHIRVVQGDANGYGWLAIVRRGYRINMLYSRNLITAEPTLDQMLHHRFFDVAFDYHDNRLALFITTYSSNPTVSVWFRKFNLEYSL